MVDKMALKQVFLRVLLFSAVQYHSTNAPYSSSLTCYSYKKDKRANLGNLSNSDVLSEIVENWIEKYFHCFF